MNGKRIYWVIFAVQISKNNGDHLWPIPLARLHLELFLTLITNTVEAKRIVPHIASRIIVHEQI